MRVLPTEAVESSTLPAFLTGLSLIRGKPCPVLDLTQLLGDKQPVARLVLVRVAGAQQQTRRVALAVSSVGGVSRTSEQALAQMPPLLSGAAQGLVEALSVHDAQLLTLLKTGSLLNDQEWAELEAG